MIYRVEKEINLKKKVLARRKSKIKCDWDKWEDEISFLACTEYIDCRGCGAWEREERKFMQEIVNELIREAKTSRPLRHIREVLDQYDDGLIFDVAVFLLNKEIEARRGREVDAE